MKNLKFLLFAVAIGIAASVTVKGGAKDDEIIMVGGKLMKRGDLPQPKNADLTAGEVLEDLFNKKGANVDEYKNAEERRRGDQLWEVARSDSNPSDFLKSDQQKIQDAAKKAVTDENADIASEAKKAELEKQGLWEKPVMASDQGDEATQKFIDAIGGIKGQGGAITTGAKLTAETARDSAKDAQRDAVRDAANTARDNARGSIDHCPPRGGCH